MPFPILQNWTTLETLSVASPGIDIGWFHDDQRRIPYFDQFHQFFNLITDNDQPSEESGRSM